ncbi:bifunctional 4-hydroxy-2-oxoglutarate aldolase/2-dehydro-3-deoxy-phosphogluconate aldolase [Streptomyces sp. NBC_00988]|uniref:bifunctional 4-hydroxy-2-oxoglutarate aldolase/2-dehydro-3-deoxy-phosphogluconate aldolase n=1 Tax=Streptomyces sp. NBC_00988 TaxID=2903704 RepID=UPI0038635B80|nr:bifunctional 4-hydroxy-2-oxoglutarate aldolase/2-dehydro-3-deoxy-phosphogluconate aldolase [Streptomyces sp. NBC_00988]
MTDAFARRQNGTADPASVLPGSRILPVLTVPSATTAAPLAEALVAGGARCVEVTLRTPAALEAVRTMAAHGGLCVGAGTVLTPEDAERAVEAGARFVLSPGYDAETVERCRLLGVPVMPGVATATEVQRALRDGVSTVKLFPAESLGGPAVIAALAAPFPGMRFVPTGGIGPARLPEYLGHPAVAAVGGSWMASAALLESNDWAQVRRLTAEAVAIGERGVS